MLKGSQYLKCFLFCFVFSNACTLTIHFIASTGLQSGPAYQIGTLPWSIQHLPHQTLLHFQHPHHPAVCPGLQSLRHFPDALNTFQRQLLGQPSGNLVCKYSKNDLAPVESALTTCSQNDNIINIYIVMTTRL